MINDLCASRFDYTIEDGVLVIEDLDDGQTVTNNAMQVLLQIQDEISQPINNRPIIYRDTHGDWDVLQMHSNHVAFLFGGGSKTTAKVIAKKYANHSLNDANCDASCSG